MEKVNCDIIQDLIPSYVDKVCSEASKRCVEEHLETCEACKKTVENYCNTDFATEAIEQKELDGYKKVKAEIKRQNVMCYGFVLILAAFGVFTFQSNMNNIPTFFYYVIFSICIVGTYFLSVNQKNWVNIGKMDMVLVGASTMISGFGIFLLCYCIELVSTGRLPFGIAAEKIGPFVHSLWGVLFILQLLIYGYMLVKLLRKNVDCRWILCLNLTGMFLLLSYVTLLTRTYAYENFQHDFIEMTAVILILGMMGVGFYLFSAFQYRKKART